MHIICTANISNDGTDAVVVVDTYPVGTNSLVRATEEFIIPAGSTAENNSRLLSRQS